VIVSSTIRTSNLTKVYGDRVVVDGLDLDVAPGEIFGLLGPNGAGKTTTILMLLGLTDPSSGSMEVLGMDPRRNPLAVKRRVGYLPDAVGFYDDLTGRQNLRFTARLNHVRDPDQRIDEVLDKVGLTAAADQRAGEYSRGMKQRLGLADALVKDPSILILDEPTTAIDPLGVVEILDLLRRLVRERGMAILLSSHLLNQVQSVCDRIGIFAAGRLIGQGTLAELQSRFGDNTGHVEVAFDVDPADESVGRRVAAMLAGIDGVVDATQNPATPGAWTLAVQPPSEELAVRRRLPEVAAANGLGLVGLGSVAPSLEDIYRRAAARTAPAHGAVR
jgi:ABC-2 type transport system ATP-binding protein